jgi:hypothetical protein
MELGSTVILIVRPWVLPAGRFDLRLLIPTSVRASDNPSMAKLSLGVISSSVEMQTSPFAPLGEAVPSALKAAKPAPVKAEPFMNSRRVKSWSFFMELPPNKSWQCKMDRCVQGLAIEIMEEMPVP